MSKPALLATYFCSDPAAAEELVEAFIRSEADLDLAPVAPGAWRNAEHKTRLWRGRLPEMTAGEVVQLVLNAPEPIPRGWQILWGQWQRAQDGAPGTVAAGLWGYTLLYQAAVDLDEDTAVEEQVQAIPPGPRDSTLSAATPHGQLWLLETPQGNGATARTVYAILGPAAGEEALAREWTWAPQGQLLALELALHRAQHQRRQCQAVAPRIDQAIRGLWATTHRLLTDPEGVTAAGGEEAELQALAEQYGRLNVVVSDLRSLRRTLSIQTANASQVAARLNLADASPFRHQLALLQETTAQAEQGIGYAEETLEAAKSALELVSARFEEREARAQERRNLIIAFLGLILATGQLISDAEARSFLAWMASQLQWAPAGPYTPFQVFFTRLALAVLIGLAGMLLVWGVGKLRKQSG